ncbi:MAG TPA: phosphoribosylformylglycinamidine synthase subunit PurS [Candidatus Marinimicrobia bacterium]|nr:phosphoribosylformylglycinamidine synthase subunit PurS [Candidatus Neomarinimicrobiota bacterium]
MAIIQVEVRLKEGILDPQGKAIQHALDSMGYKDCQSVQCGKFFELDFGAMPSDEALKQAEAVAKKILANPNIEVFFLKVKE